jgi:hypothetical protein
VPITTAPGKTDQRLMDDWGHSHQELQALFLGMTGRSMGIPGMSIGQYGEDAIMASDRAALPRRPATSGPLPRQTD